jgi:mono/diheme cytochrome c family protein
VGTYRLLAGVGYQPKSLAGNYAFTSRAPVAVSPDAYNRSEAETDTRVAYGKGMSEWCGNCHGGIHSDQNPGPGNFRHPAGSDVRLGTALAANYSRYDFRTGATDADGSAAYSSLVPFEMGTEVRADLLAATLSTAGPSAAGTENVSCATCHRAHASPFPDMGRWNFGLPMIWDGYPSPIWYYGRDQSYFAAYQRSLCNKCHVKD